ncbi:MAG: YceK/YidQ family lipoprotein [Nitrospiraceae bacterium]|nr:YceK/YidQ family lipoprotein [Nitrospiraceae bacterium]
MLIIISLSHQGCATVKTMPNLGSYGTPKLYSGTRLDYNAATGDTVKLEEFKSESPDSPVLDMPFSALLDTIILPITLSVTLYEVIFEK